MHLPYPLLVAIIAWMVPTTGACLYLLLLTCLSGRGATPGRATRTPFFDVIVPAHNEASGIRDTVSNLRQLDWPAERFRVVVIADNCSDETARVAREAGALVIERQDAVLRGKGYALDHIFKWSRADGKADAVVVVDADSKASANLLQSFASRLELGDHATQAHYGVLNPSASWRTRLMTIALGAIHRLRSRARERLGLSCGIRGNGWCVTHALLDAIPYKAYSLTEDVEFGVDMGLAGYRVAYCDEASVDGEMVTTASAAGSQRQRWESGRLGLIRSRVPPLLGRTITARSLVCLDLALDLLILPLSYIVLSAAVLLAIAIALALTSPTTLQLTVLWVGIANAAALAAYVCRGWALSGIGLEGFWDLLRVPAFIGWKLVLLVSGPKTTTWIRTRRERS
ncbi:MAG TPA: glycosyltransferase family 2 protein [Steroidobacteraceae bacterium]|jgi:cellulose synthase/poly-beta-1,6-N-acetylglucosamine synthase-like glycosyltransferase